MQGSPTTTNLFLAHIPALRWMQKFFAHLPLNSNFSPNSYHVSQVKFHSCNLLGTVDTLSLFPLAIQRNIESCNVIDSENYFSAYVGALLLADVMLNKTRSALTSDEVVQHMITYVINTWPMKSTRSSLSCFNTGTQVINTLCMMAYCLRLLTVPKLN